jgi:ABC-2 type transport system ATP-binding protein
MIEVINLEKKIGNKVILQDISFILDRGEITFIYGVNGAGKTTLINCLTNFYKYEKGTVKINVNSKSEIGLFLGQETLIEKLRVNEYLNFVAHLKELDKSKIDTKVDELLLKLSLESYKNYLISDLSLGTKTKVLLASSIINNPKILIMDEPFIGLDLISFRDISKFLIELKNNGCCIFISSHQVDFTENIIDRILILKNSKIIVNDNLKNLSISNASELSNFVINNLL